MIEAHIIKYAVLYLAALYLTSNTRERSHAKHVHH